MVRAGDGLVRASRGEPVEPEIFWVAALNRRAAWSFVPLIGFALVFTFAGAVLSLHGLNTSRESEMLWSVCWRLALVWWVYVDRQGRVLGLPFEFDAFVFFAWLFLVPYYLYKTRGVRGLLLAAAIFALSMVPSVVGFAVRVSH
jgi:hypothetical protein